MPRVIFLHSVEREKYFVTLKSVSGLSWKKLAKKFQISQRQLTDIKKGKF